MLVESGIDNWLVGPYNSRIGDPLELLTNLLPGISEYCLLSGEKKETSQKKPTTNFSILYVEGEPVTHGALLPPPCCGVCRSLIYATSGVCNGMFSS